MCKLKLHMVEEPRPLKTSHIKAPSTSTPNSLASLRDSLESLAQNPILYTSKEIADATTRFSVGRMGNSSVWKCALRGKTVAITVRKQKRKIGDFRSGLRDICNAHHASIVNLLGGCCEGHILYLVYEYVQGSNLGDCLRGSKVPGYTVLGSWISRMQIALDVAQGLEYMHHDSKMNYVHNYIKSSSILVTEPGYRARICHLGASYLAGEYDAGGIFDTQGDSNANVQSRNLHQRSSLKITGTQGYMAPEYIASGIVSQKADVFALGVVLLELLSGHEPIRYVQADEGGRRMKRIGLIQTLNTLSSESDNNFTGRLRSWIDPGLKDSFPVDCAERVARIASSCVDPDPGKRPDTRYVAREVSKVFMMSAQWAEQMKANKGSVSGTFEAR